MITRVLTIAGSDSSGGAGIQADIKAIMAMGGYVATAITAVTAQNTLGVKAIDYVSEAVIESQIRLCIEDIGIDAIKTGMLATKETIQLVAKLLDEYPNILKVIDPVMVATSGSNLMQEEAVSLYRELMVSRANLLTPNVPEAEKLTGQMIIDVPSMIKAALALQEMGAQHVLLKGGHLIGDRLVDILVTEEGQIIEYENVRIPTNHTHGTGCTLASAIACLWVTLPLERAVEQAREYVYKAIVTAPQLGKGHGPINHLYPRII